MRHAPSSERSILAADAGLNILVGIVILLFPVTGGRWLGLPDATPFLFSSVLGALLVAVGLALLVQRAGGSGLGLAGAAVLDLLGAGAAFAWLGLGGSAIPAPGRWVVAATALVAIALAGLGMMWRGDGVVGAAAAGGSRVIVLRPIGVIRTPFRISGDAPIQPSRAGGAEGVVEVAEEYREGLNDLEGFSHIVLLYHFDRSTGFELRVTPYLDRHRRGLFATRSPRRPNPIGLSVVRLLEVAGSRLRVADVDMLDRTPLLDIKPYVPEFDHRPEIRIGWLEEAIRRRREEAPGGVS